jgi:hypothetical protein
MNRMARIEQIAQAARDGDALMLRSHVQDWLRENPRFVDCLAPATSDATLLAIAASIVELLAQRRQQPPPAWTEDIAPADHPLYLVKSALTMPRLRRLCESESPAPLRRRNLFAPPTFLEFA